MKTMETERPPAPAPPTEAKTITLIEAINQALHEEMERDERIFLIGEDIAGYGGVFKATKGLYERFGPMRVIDSPISENFLVQGMVGAAIAGLIPSPRSSSTTSSRSRSTASSSTRPRCDTARAACSRVRW
jgi:hypothetical protein